MRVAFRTKIFLAVFGVAGIIILAASALLSVWLSRQTNERIQRTLISDVRLISDLLGDLPEGASPDSIALEADRAGKHLGLRVTLIGADGRVLGDSSVPRSQLGGLENHNTRPEVAEARRTGLGIAQRLSRTVGEELLYVAAPVAHRTITIARVAVPLTEVRTQLAAVRHLTLAALAVALASALGLAFLSSSLLARRVRAIAETARRYASGEVDPPPREHEDDELGTVASVLDQTVRSLKERVDELAHDRARLDAIVSGMQEGVLLVDGRGNLQLVNRAARDLLKLEEDALGRPYPDCIQNQELVAVLGATLEGQPSGSIELAPSPNPERALVGRVGPVATPGGSGALLVLHDMTDLRRADQVRRDFVANVSHELRTPLTAIRGYVEALGDDPLDPADRQRFLEIVARHTERMERLVKDLLRLVRLEARQEPIEPGWHSIEDTLRGVVSDLASAIEAKEQRAEVHVDPAIGSVLTDGPKLQDALRNIVENAVNYSPPATLIELAAGLRGDRIVITVSDYGPGIPPSDLARIFERFYRVDKARSRESGGTGLGLSIVKHLVERLSGEVWASNRPEGGSVFTIVIPRTIAPLLG